MKILVTGANGFIGSNLVSELRNRGYKDIYLCDVDTDAATLDYYCQNCDFVFHLAGVLRPKDDKEFMNGNYGFTTTLIEKLKSFGNRSPILLTSSIQAALENPYGQSKKAGEDYLFKYSEETKIPVLIYRLPNAYGKWARPNYSSVIATFCYNISRGLPIQINDPSTILRLVYIDDVVNEFISALEGNGHKNGMYYQIPIEDSVTLGKVAETIKGFKAMRENLSVPNLANHFEKCLYSTYLSYLPENDFAYPLQMKCDHRGSFTEIIKTFNAGQVSINISLPGITKGNHWHHTKNEKFLVVAGHCLIKFRKVGCQEIITYDVSGDKLEVVDIPCGYTHNITNVGETNSVTLMWCNEIFDPQHPDTYFMEVETNETK